MQARLPDGTRRFRLPVSVGVILAVLGLGLLCMAPFMAVDLAMQALGKLHLPRVLAWLALAGIVVGGLINIPLVGPRVGRAWRYGGRPVSPMFPGESQVLEPELILPDEPDRDQPVLSVNVGGCLVPLLIALWQLVFILPAGLRPILALLAATTASILACALASRPLRGVGILLPIVVPAVASVGVAWAVLLPAEFAPLRAPVAFVAAVLGPLVGADFVHLRAMLDRPAAPLSIGGAGTFDAIVVSGIAAAVLA
jgi:uncharacterized membrane protein